MFTSLVYSAPYIKFNPPLPSSVCNGEKINITYEGIADTSLSYANAVKCVFDGYFDVSFDIMVMEYDPGSYDDQISRSDRWGKTYDCQTVNLAWPNPTSTFNDVDLSLQAGGAEGDTIEVYIEAVNDCTGCGIKDVSNSAVDVDILYNCDCLSGSCCYTSSRPYTYKPSGSQPIGYTDNYVCSGDNTPIGTNWVYKTDYYCDGVSSSAKYKNTLVDTCGPCEYCTPGDSTCNYYDSSTVCGTEDCDYLDTTCRDYNDKDRHCNGAGTCLSPSCDSYTNKPKHTSCGTGKECDGSGNCITCTSHHHSGCYDNDVYWYDKCDNLQEKKDECGEDSCSSIWTYYCDGYDLMKKRWCFDRGCMDNGCYNSAWEDKEYIKTCAHGCEEGGPQGAQCREICYQDSDCGSESRYNPHCGSDGNIYMTYQIPHCGNPGNQNSYCYYNEEDRLVEHCQFGCTNGNCNSPPCTDQCSYGQTRCNGDYSQTCGNYDSNICLEWPSSTSGDGNEFCTYGCHDYDGKCQDEMACFLDSDCGWVEWLHSIMCKNGDVWMVGDGPRCINPGTPEAYCDSTSYWGSRKKQECGEDYTTYSNDYCLYGNVYYDTTWHNHGCTTAGGPHCYSTTTEIPEVLKKECINGCTNGQCNEDKSMNFNINLNQGWNLISFPLNLTSKLIKDVSKNINFKSIFSYGSWHYYFNETHNNFKIINESKGYWINSLGNQILTIEGTKFDSLNIPSKKGSNLIGYPSLNEKAISTLLKNVKVYTYNNSKWYSYDSNRPPQLNTLDKFTPGYGYWVKIP